VLNESDEEGGVMNGKILLVLVLACGTAQAAEWVSLGKTINGTQEILVDTSSIRIAGDSRKAWVKTVYAPHTMKGASANPNKWWTTDLSQEAFKCGEGTHRRESLTVYYNDGTNYVGPAEEYPTPWSPVPPETVGDLEMQFVCAWKQR
jgi:hypothetical protein